MYGRIVLLNCFRRTHQLTNANISSFGNVEGRTLNSLFFEPEVHELLRCMTPLNVEHVLKPKKLGQELKPPKYQFMSNKELQESILKCKQQAEKLMQLPPVIDERSEIKEVLDDDKALDGFDLDDSKFIFCDISLGVKEQEKTVVVREPNGVLRKAYWSERARIDQMFSPREGRSILVPKMFKDEHINRLLNAKEYIFILDCACAQFEPDDPLYQKIVSTTYKRIYDENDFLLVDHSRHFGSLAFYLVINKSIDKLLVFNINLQRLPIAASLCKLYCIVHNEVHHEDQDPVNVLQAFIKKYYANTEVELAFQKYVELQKEKEELERGIKSAEGTK